MAVKKHKPIKLFIPASILSVITENVKRNTEIYIYIIHYILCRPIQDKRHNNFAPINKDKIKLIINCNPNNYIKLLEKYELIENDKKYIPNKKTFHYRINPKHKTNLVSYELQPDTSLFKNIIKRINNNKTNYSKLEPYLYKMAKEFMSIQYDFDSALSWINTIQDEDKKSIYAISINQFNDVRFRYFKRNTTNNRLDTNLTNLKKELRQHIKGNYVSIDLKNSQPFLLSFLLEKIAKILQYFYLKKLNINQYTIEDILNNKHLPYCLQYDIDNLIKYFGLQSFKSMLLIRKNYDFLFFTNLSLFKSWVSNGVFYDEFIKKYDNELKRDEVKQIMFEVIFSQNVIHKDYKKFVPYAIEKNIFACVFPVIYELIKILKDKQHNKLAIYLQKLESNLFIDNIAKRLVENGIIPLTIHDSIIIPKEQQEKALNIVKSVFKDEIRTIPAFHIEPLNPIKQMETIINNAMSKFLLSKSNLYANYCMQLIA